uniref:Uncharacterized protein n=1 Tax=Clandestinovirus TaxID=2831644 RepID=A0A8F8KLR4_9VIRU|nr:hypothetical protein KOM_12_178 [Clandestinovirus]
MNAPKVQIIVCYYVDGEFNTERYLVPQAVFNACEEAKVMLDEIRSAKMSDKYFEDLALTNDEEKFGPLGKLLLQWENEEYYLSPGRLQNPVTIVEEYFLESDPDCKWTLWEPMDRPLKRKREEEEMNANKKQRSEESLPEKESIELEYEEQEDWESFVERYIEDDEEPLFTDTAKTRDQFIKIRKPCLKKFGFRTMLECSDARERLRDVMLILNGKNPFGIGLECTQEERDAYDQVIADAFCE